MNTRAARTSSVGVIRAGEEVMPLPEPWLVDLSRSGMRCMIEDQSVTFWRPDASQEARFTLVPADRSYKADFLSQRKLNLFKRQWSLSIRNSRELSLQLSILRENLFHFSKKFVNS